MNNLNFIRDPLTHFLVLSGIIYLFIDIFIANDNIDTSIVVNESTLIDFLQYTSQTYNNDLTQHQLKNLNKAELDNLVQAYIEEEAIYREAIRDGLAENDDVIKNRLIDHYKYSLKESSLDISTDLNKDQLLTFYNSNIEEHSVPESISFIHIFFDAKKRNLSERTKITSDLLKNLNDLKSNTKLDEATSQELHKMGDNFIYHSQYIDANKDYLKSHFGQPMTDQMFSIPVASSSWQGPFHSRLGTHILLVTDKKAKRYRTFKEVESRVYSTYISHLQELRYEENVKKIISNYDITISLP